MKLALPTQCEELKKREEGDFTAIQNSTKIVRPIITSVTLQYEKTLNKTSGDGIEYRMKLRDLNRIENVRRSGYWTAI